MTKRAKDILLLFILKVLLFVVLLIVTSLLSVSIVFAINSFNKVNGIWYLLSLIPAILLSAIMTFIRTHPFEREYRFVRFVNNHFNGFLLFIIFLSLFFTSIHSEIRLTDDKPYLLLEVEWTIFAISAGLFTIWHLVVYSKKYDSQSKQADEENEEKEALKKLFKLYETMEDNYKYRTGFDPVFYLSVNALALVLTTGQLFLAKNYTILQEIMLFFSLYASTNALVNVFIEILADLFKTRRDLIKKTNVNASAVNKAKTIAYYKPVFDFLETSEKNGDLLFIEELAKQKKCEQEYSKMLLILDEYKKDKNSLSNHSDELPKLYKRFMSKIKKKK